MTAARDHTAARRVLDMMTLVALAVAYPLFDILSRSPEFFVARNTTFGDLVAIMTTICVVLPLLLALLGLAAGRIDVRLGTALHYAAFGTDSSDLSIFH